MTKSLFLLLVVFPFTQIKGQGVQLDNFSVFQYNQKVFLSWVISAGSTCNGIAIERSNDGVEYTEVGYIPGVCGSATDPRPYSFIDPNPLPNQINYYRLELGLQGYSETRSLEFIAVGEQGLVLLPNPASDQVEIRINNSNARQHAIEVISMTGRVVLQQNFTSNAFMLKLFGLQSGLYIIRITNEFNDNVLMERLAVR